MSIATIHCVPLMLAITLGSLAAANSVALPAPAPTPAHAPTSTPTTTTPAPRAADLENDVQALLIDGAHDIAIERLAAALAVPAIDHRLAYLHAVALERRALANATPPATESDLFFGRRTLPADALRPSTDALLAVLEVRGTDALAGARPDFTLAHRSRITWCTPDIERYPDDVHAFSDVLACITYGPLNLRSGHVAMPNDAATLRRYAAARLVHQAQSLNDAQRDALATAMTDRGINHARLLLTCNFTNCRRADHWTALTDAHPDDEALFVIAAIEGTVVGTPADRIVPAYNQLLDRYPVLAAQVVGWANARNLTFDRTQLATRHTADERVFRLLDHHRGPASIRNFAIVTESDDGETKVLSAITDDDGIFILPKTLVSAMANREHRLTVDGYLVGALKDTNGVLIEVQIPFGLGEPAPHLALAPLDASGSVDVQDFRGRVVYIDFWATWCAPCQAPLAHLNEVARRREAAWRDRVAVLAISNDAEPSIAARHVADRNWTAVRNFHVSPDDEHFRDAYAVRGWPTAMLIDADGTVIWRGHPADIDVEARIDALLARQRSD